MLLFCNLTFVTDSGQFSHLNPVSYGLLYSLHKLPKLIPFSVHKKVQKSEAQITRSYTNNCKYCIGFVKDSLKRNMNSTFWVTVCSHFDTSVLVTARASGRKKSRTTNPQKFFFQDPWELGLIWSYSTNRLNKKPYIVHGANDNFFYIKYVSEINY